jgi:TonB family protein
MKLLFIPFLLISLKVFSQQTTQGSISVKKAPALGSDTISNNIISIPGDFGPIPNYDTLPPEYIGGEAAMKKFINSNLKYPENSRYKGLSGNNSINFTVGEDGSISNVRVSYPMRGCSECDTESIRIVKLMPKWKPGVFKPTGANVASTGTVTVRFTFLK